MSHVILKSGVGLSYALAVSLRQCRCMKREALNFWPRALPRLTWLTAGRETEWEVASVSSPKPQLSILCAAFAACLQTAPRVYG